MTKNENKSAESARENKKIYLQGFKNLAGNKNDEKLYTVTISFHDALP